MQKTFLTVGTDTIVEELFRPIADSVDDFGGIKIRGGLWLNPYLSNGSRIIGNPWLDYLAYHPEYVAQMYELAKNKNANGVEATVVTLKDSANIYEACNADDILSLAEEFPGQGYEGCSADEILSSLEKTPDKRKGKAILCFEKAFEEHDGIYLRPDFYEKENPMLGDVFHRFDRGTALVLANSNPIDYYQSASIDLSYNPAVESTIRIEDTKKTVPNAEAWYPEFIDDLCKRIRRLKEQNPNKNESEFIAIAINEVLPSFNHKISQIAQKANMTEEKVGMILVYDTIKKRTRVF